MNVYRQRKIKTRNLFKELCEGFISLRNDYVSSTATIVVNTKKVTESLKSDDNAK